MSSEMPRQAATLVVVRDAPHGLELLLLRRADKGDHNSGAWVFPGGLVDPGDRRCHAVCAGLDDVAASARLGVADGGLDHYVAAIRECFEEAGILFAVDERGQPVDMLVDTGTALADLRAPLHRGECDFASVCREFGLRLAADRLFYIAHWVTPPGRAKRFDTRFFLAVLPEGQSSAHDALETVDHVWLRPEAALASENSRRLMTPTRTVIGTIARFADARALLDWARSPREVVTVAPRLALDGGGLRPVQPHEPAYAEIGRVDPEGQGVAWCELRPETPVRLSPRVLRVTAAGASGWNSYLVGSGDAWAAIDPGPDEAGHLDALAAAAPGRIRWILLTDVQASPSAAALQGRTGAPVRPAISGATIRLAGDATLRVLDGGEPNGRMFLLVEEGTLFTGAQTPAAGHWPPELEWIAPGRGFLAAAPAQG